MTRTLLFRVALGVALLSAGCFVDPSALPPETRLPCADNGDCPVGWTCRTALGRCLKAEGSDDVAPVFVVPPVVAPARVSRVAGHDVAFVTFTLDEPVDLEGGGLSVSVGAARAVCEEAAADDGAAYACRYQVADDDEEGHYDVTVLAVDDSGNLARETAAVFFDFSPPVLADVVLSPASGPAGLGQTFLARLFLDEPLAGTPALVASDGDTSFPLTRTDGGGASALTFSWIVGPGDDGDFTLTLEGVEDEAGNRAPAPLAVGEALFDATAPTIAAVDVDQRRYSAVSPHDLVTLTFDVAEGPPAAVDARLAGVPMTCSPCSDGAPSTCACSYTVSTADPAGTHNVLVSVDDAAGNRAVDGSALVELDFSGPAVVEGTVAVTLGGGVGNPLPAPEAVTVGTRALLSLALSEVPAGDVEASTSDGAMVFAPRSGEGPLRVFEGTLLAAPAQDGAVDVTVRATDDVGNVATSTLPDLLVIDTEPPPSPDVGTPDRVVYRRAPWGTRDSGGAPSFSVEGAAASDTHTVIVYADASANAELGRAPVTAGAFAATLLPADRGRVFVAEVDAAGNRSPAVEVRDIEWRASLYHKVRGRPDENPTVLSVTSALTSALRPWDLVEASQEEIDALAAGDAAAVDVTSAAPFVKADAAQADPGLFSFGGAAYDEERGVLVASGFSADSTRETWELDLRAWRWTLRATGQSAADLMYDPKARQVRGRWSGTELTWTGSAWRALSDTAPGSVLAADDRSLVAVHTDSVGFPPVVVSDTRRWLQGQWAVVDDATTPPIHVVARDPASGELLALVGDRSDDAASTWRFSDDVWTELCSTRDGDCGALDRMRWDAALTPDRGRGTVLLVGGNYALPPNDPVTYPTADVLAWNAAASRWDIVAGVDIGAREQASAVDTPRGVFVLGGQRWVGQNTACPAGSVALSSTSFSGGLCTSASGCACRWQDLWLLDASPHRFRLGGVDWVRRPGAGGGVDERRQVAVFFGGDAVAESTCDDGQAGPCQDTWEHDGLGWHRACLDPSCQATRPSERDAAKLAFATAEDAVLLFGGEVLRYDDPPSCPPDTAAVVVHNYAGSFACLYADTWAWDGESWTPRADDSAGPPPRRSASVATHPSTGEVWLTGGYVKVPTGAACTVNSVARHPQDFGGGGCSLTDGCECDFVDTWRWSAAQDRWIALTTGSAPPTSLPSALHATDDELVLLRPDGDARLRELWRWSDASGAWEMTSLVDDAPRANAVSSPPVVWDPMRGRLTVGAEDGVYELADGASSWTALATEPALVNLAGEGIGFGAVIERTAAGSFHDVREQVLFVDLANNNVFFRGGVDERPAAVLAVPLPLNADEHLARATASVDVRCGGGGDVAGVSTDGCDVLAWSAAAGWTTLGANVAGADSPASFRATGDAPPLVTGAPRGLVVAVTSAAPAGAATTAARVVVEELELALAYRLAACGDGVVEGEEWCDDANADPLDGCSRTCLPAPVCGDGALDDKRAPAESCDDGNTAPGDGCDGACQREPGYRCDIPGSPCVVFPDEWSCDERWYGTDDGCDCGCGALDADCAGDASVQACDYRHCPFGESPLSTQNWLCQ